VLQSATDVPTGNYTCIGPSTCFPTYYPMNFEGRPIDGTEVQPGKSDRWELKYVFSPAAGVRYAANIAYEVKGTSAVVNYHIYTYSTSNESSCKVTPASAGRCTAEGVHLTFQKP
jgi:hypothetical protein